MDFTVFMGMVFLAAGTLMFILSPGDVGWIAVAVFCSGFLFGTRAEQAVREK